MEENEAAAIRLNALINDIDAQTLFAKDGPLNWFSPQKTMTSFVRKGYFTGKQCSLIERVHREFLDLKKVSGNFVGFGMGREVARILYAVLQDKPKNVSREDRGRSQRISKILHVFSEGKVVHIGHFNSLEILIGELPIEMEKKDRILEKIHLARRKYLMGF